MDQNSLRAQLAPGWTPLNIIIMVALFIFVWWPFGLLMLAYILLGSSFGLNLAEPDTFKEAFARLSGGATGSGGSTTHWSGERTDTGTPGSSASNTTEVSDEAERLRQEREVLARERADFEAEKQAFEQQRREDA